MKSSKRLEGIGEYYFSKKLEEVRSLQAKGKPVINLGIGSPDLPPSSEVISATIASLNDPTAHGYSSYVGIIELRQAMANWYKKTFQVNLKPESEVLPLLGSKIGILYASLAFLDPGDQALIPDPGYPTYRSATLLAGAEPVTYDLTSKNSWKVDFQDLEKRNLGKVKLMWVNYPHMPTGSPADSKFFEQLIDFAIRHDILIIHDNPYALILNSQSPLSILKFDPGFKNVIELNSLSKAFNMAGWRVGLFAGHKDYIQTILQVKSNADTGAFIPLQKGAIEALKADPQWHEQRNKVYRVRQKTAYQILEGLGFKCAPKQEGLFVWGEAPDSVPDVPAFLDRVLYESNVFITPGFIFGKNGQRYARVSLCQDIGVLQSALKNILEGKWK